MNDALRVLLANCDGPCIVTARLANRRSNSSITMVRRARRRIRLTVVEQFVLSPKRQRGML